MENNKDNIIVNKTLNFALDVISLYKELILKKKEYVLSKQLLKSGTSIGANVSEAIYGQSRADFIHKMNLSLKEANESSYWLVLLYKSNYLDELKYQKLKIQIQEILNILIKIVKTSKEK